MTPQLRNILVTIFVLCLSYQIHSQSFADDNSLTFHSKPKSPPLNETFHDFDFSKISEEDWEALWEKLRDRVHSSEIKKEWDDTHEKIVEYQRKHAKDHEKNGDKDNDADDKKFNEKILKELERLCRDVERDERREKEREKEKQKDKEREKENEIPSDRETEKENETDRDHKTEDPHEDHLPEEKEEEMSQPETADPQEETPLQEDQETEHQRELELRNYHINMEYAKAALCIGFFILLFGLRFFYVSIFLFSFFFLNYFFKMLIHSGNDEITWFFSIIFFFVSFIPVRYLDTGVYLGVAFVYTFVFSTLTLLNDNLVLLAWLAATLCMLLACYVTLRYPKLQIMFSTSLFGSYLMMTALDCIFGNIGNLASLFGAAWIIHFHPVYVHWGLAFFIFPLTLIGLVLQWGYNDDIFGKLVSPLHVPSPQARLFDA